MIRLPGKWSQSDRRPAARNKSGFVFKPNSTKITDHIPAKLQTQNILSRLSLPWEMHAKVALHANLFAAYSHAHPLLKKILVHTKRIAQNNWSN
jgi:hypothetical protein